MIIQRYNPYNKLYYKLICNLQYPNNYFLSQVTDNQYINIQIIAMPIAQNEQLFKLIQSLEKAEKRHFKLYVNRLDSNKNVMFIKLFDILEKSKSLDEQKIKKSFPKIKSSDFTNLKRHLYSQILKSLRLLHSRHDIDIQIREQIDYAKILYGKSLYLQSLKLLDRIIPLAKDSNQEILLLEILEFEKLIESRHITRSRNIKDKVEGLITLSTRSNVTISRTSEISNLSLMIQGLYIKMGFVKNDKERFLVESYFKSNIPSVLSKNPGFYEEILLHQSYVWFHYMTLEYELSLERAIQWVDVFDNNPIMQKKDPDLYLRGMHYVLTNNFYLNNKEDFSAWKKRYFKFIKNNEETFNETTKLLNFIYGNNIKINELILKRKFQETNKLEKEIFEEMKEFSLQIDSHRVKMFHYKFAWLKIAIGDFQSAIDHLNYILQPKKGHLRKDLICYAKILNLIANFHLKNYVLVQNLIPAVKRTIEKQGEQSGALSMILTMLNKKQSDDSFNAFVDKLLKKLEKIKSYGFDKRIFNYFDFFLWAQSLSEGSKMSEIYPEV